MTCYCQTDGYQCEQGRRCPLSDTEAANTVPLDPNVEFPAPKGKRMQFYRQSSSALTGRAPRSMSAAFGCHHNDPVHPMPDGAPALLDVFGRAAAGIGQFVARLLGR